MPTDDKKNEGEGSKTADRNYRKGIEEFKRTNDPQELGRQAAHDIESDKETYRDAEKQGKARIAEEDPEIRK